MLITTGHEDHPMKGPGTSVHNPHCYFSWTFRCCGYDIQTGLDPRTRKAIRARVACERERVINCAGGQHIPLETAIAQIETEGWRLADQSNDGGAGWRCPTHA